MLKEEGEGRGGLASCCAALRVALVEQQHAAAHRHAQRPNLNGFGFRFGGESEERGQGGLPKMIPIYYSEFERW